MLPDGIRHGAQKREKQKREEEMCRCELAEDRPREARDREDDERQEREPHHGLRTALQIKEITDLHGNLVIERRRWSPVIGHDVRQPLPEFLEA